MSRLPGAATGPGRWPAVLRLLLPLAILLVASSGVTASPQPGAGAPTLRVWLHARAIRPGEVVLITVRPSRPLASLEGEALDRTLRFWRPEGSRDWRALVALPLETSPGMRRISLRGAADGGAEVTKRVSFTVARARFATRRLRVDETFVHPPAEVEDRMMRESQALADVFSRQGTGRLWRGPFDLPVPGRSTSGFGRLSILNGEPRGRHQGADFEALEGTPVLAPNAGEVALAAEHYVAGNLVVLDHGDGLFSLFAHLSRIAVQTGALVSRGDLLGEAGATGRVTGPHLHWTVRLQGASVDPLSLVAALAYLKEEAPSVRP